MDQDLVTLKTVLERFEYLGTACYNGKHFDNVLNIFNDLEDQEKKVLLRAVYKFYRISSAPPRLDTAPMPLHMPRTEVEQANATNYHEQQMVMFKFWFLKWAMLIFGTGVLLMAAMVFFFSLTGAGDATVMGKLFKIFGLMFE